MDERPLSSGDLIADRRYEYGADFARAGDHGASADLFEQTIERAPDWAPAWLALGRARLALGDAAAAAAAFRECLKRDPDDMHGASLELSRIDAAVSIDVAPPAYVTALFDAYAGDFDSALVERLGYATPRQLTSLLREVSQRREPFARVLDLGCGTGLLGECIARQAVWLEGVDLSSRMLEQARKKAVYDALHKGELLSYLLGATQTYDAIIAADVLIYFGDLAHVFFAAARRLAPGGLFAFSVEQTDDADWRIRPSLRYAHHANYIAGTLKECGLDLLRMEQAVLRKDRGKDVEGLLVLARNPLTRADDLTPFDTVAPPHDEDEAALH